MLTEKIKTGALKLDVIDRIHLAEIILDSLDKTDEQIEKTGFNRDEVELFLDFSAILGKYIHAEYDYIVSRKRGSLINNLIHEPYVSAKFARKF